MGRGRDKGRACWLEDKIEDLTTFLNQDKKGAQNFEIIKWMN